MKIQERFIKYAKIDTQSDPKSVCIPSSEKQKNLGKVLVEELLAMNLENVHMDEFGIVYAVLPSNVDKTVETIGFLAHMDTAPDYSGANVQPQIIENYDGKDIVLNAEKGIVLRPSEFPSLCDHLHKTLIVGDGTTLLGADDKAGIAEIMEMLNYFYHHPKEPHGKVAIAFTCDEEVGRGTDHFNVEKFNAHYAYTVDGGDIAFVNYENFNAARALISVQGSSVHPGDAKGKMINASMLAMEFQALMPNRTPANTERKEGFIHLHEMKGRCEDAQLEYLLRDHDEGLLQKQKECILEAVKMLNERYEKPLVKVEINDEYRNMASLFQDKMEIVDDAIYALKQVGVKAKSLAIRGGTDGARLSFMGLPCPNIGTGGFNFHGKYEYVCVESMELISDVLIQIVKGKLTK
ncbi:MAG: peptidase T [Breznakia sp.]